jgi:hypothetical protein
VQDQTTVLPPSPHLYGGLKTLQHDGIAYFTDSLGSYKIPILYFQGKNQTIRSDKGRV